MPFLLKNGPNSNKVEKGHILPLRRIKSHNFINNMVNALIHSYKVRLIMLFAKTNKQNYSSAESVFYMRYRRAHSALTGMNASTHQQRHPQTNTFNNRCNTVYNTIQFEV